ncbi:cell division protein FtsL [Clostridium estertheticum]|uniref:cell division protein FtsL n=1 Tax=Clostridium estertheticum TaxID=238834 RepID=UPI0013E90988|nr:cell division protein FtsL [Clostridium estertheticum]MBZ9688049.1 cell division protein FtsL [Clostridium estertheticum]
MIVEKNKFGMDGNTVLAPENGIQKRKYEELEKSRQQTNQSKKLKDIKKKKNALTNIFLVFIIGVVIIARYCMIYNYQDTTSKAKAQIDVLSKENDAYKVQLLKFRNISYIEKTATEKLHMVKPRISDVQYCNLSKNNLGTTENSKIKVSNEIVNKIKNFIF